MPVPFALGAELLLVSRLHALGVLDERAQLREPGFRERRVGRQLVVPATRRLQVAPRRPCCRSTAELLLAAEAVEHLELVRRPREPALLELARHRDHPLDCRGDILPCCGAPPGVRPRAAVPEDTPGYNERVLVLRLQLAELFELVREVELRLDVRLLTGGADVGVVAFRTEQEPEGLGEDRLAGAGLPGDRVQPGRELELRLTDEDEILDAKPTKHAADRRPTARRRPFAL